MHIEISSRKLLREFEKIKDILSREKDNNWIRGVEAIIENLEWSLNEKCNDPECFFIDLVKHGSK